MCLSWLVSTSYSFRTLSTGGKVFSRLLQMKTGTGPATESSVESEPASSSSLPALSRVELWKTVSRLERRAVELLTTDSDTEEAIKLLAESVILKRQDPFIALSESYGPALAENGTSSLSVDQMVADLKQAGVPPHLSSLAQQPPSSSPSSIPASSDTDGWALEQVDLSSTFSDVVTEKIRVKVSSSYDAAKSEPANGKFMFWYKVAIHNEGIEPVQVVARMWEIEKCGGEKEIVKGAGIMSSQPIIPAGDVFTYQSVCPLKVTPPRGKRILGSMAGAYSMAKGNMGQVTPVTPAIM